MRLMGWDQTWAVIGVLGSLILGGGGIAITVLISMKSENRVAQEGLGKRIDDLRELVLKLVPDVPSQSDPHNPH